METLENELELLISKVKSADNFCSEIETIQNVYPFNKCDVHTSCYLYDLELVDLFGNAVIE